MNTEDIKKQLAKLRRDKRLLWLGVLFFVMVVFWILASIFATSKTSSVSAELRELAKSFVPRLESKVFDEIMSKRLFSHEELGSFPVYVFDKKNSDGTSPMIDIIATPEEVASGSTETGSTASESTTTIDEPTNEPSEFTEQATLSTDQATSSASN